MSSGDLGIWIGLALTSVGMIMGGTIHVQARFSEAKREAEERVAKAKAELEARHEADLKRVEAAVDEERTERRRELDRMEKTLEGFADVASAVVAMGKSIEHIAERFTDHQRHYERDQTELKASIKGIEQSLAQQSKARRSRAKPT